MIRRIPHNATKASSKYHLNKRVAYLEDKKHRKHRGKEILCARNYGCGPTASEFIDEVLRLDRFYRDSRKGSRGRHGRRIFEEVVFRPPPGARLDESERRRIECTIVRFVARETACRTAWHIDHSTGECDFHLILAARTKSYPPVSTLWSRYKGSKHLSAELGRVDEEIIAFLSARRPALTLKSPKQVAQAKTKKKLLALEIEKFARGPISAEKLPAWITAAGHAVVSKTSKSLLVRFKGSERVFRYNLEKLIQDTKEAVAKKAIAIPPPAPDGPEI